MCAGRGPHAQVRCLPVSRRSGRRITQIDGWSRCNRGSMLQTGAVSDQHLGVAVSLGSKSGEHPEAALRPCGAPEGSPTGAAS